jgi:hypothetical protein
MKENRCKIEGQKSCGATKEKKTQLIWHKQWKKLWVYKETKKTRKEKNFCIVLYSLHWWIRALGPQRGQKNERVWKAYSFVAQTSLWDKWKFLIHCIGLLFWALVNTMHNKYPWQQNRFNKRIIRKNINTKKENTIQLFTRQGDCSMPVKPNNSK